MRSYKVPNCVTKREICFTFQFIAIALFAVIGLAAATDKDAEATLVDGSEKVAEYFIPEGYDYKFKTSNDITKSEKANLDSGRVTGEYSYISPEGWVLSDDYEYYKKWKVNFSVSLINCGFILIDF